MNQDKENLPELSNEPAPEEKKRDRRAFATGLAALTGAAALFASKAQAAAAPATQDEASRALKSKLVTRVNQSLVEPVEGGGDPGLYSKSGGFYSKG